MRNRGMSPESKVEFLPLGTRRGDHPTLRLADQLRLAAMLALLCVCTFSPAACARDSLSPTGQGGALPPSEQGQPAVTSGGPGTRVPTVLTATDLDGFDPTALAVGAGGEIYLGRARTYVAGGYVVSKGRVELLTPSGPQRLWEGDGLPSILVSSPKNLYLVTEDSIDGLPWQTLRLVVVAGAAATQLAQYDRTVRLAALIVADGYLYSSVVWPSSSSGGAIGRTSLNDGSSGVLASAVPTGPLTVFAGTLAWVAGSSVYRMSNSGGSIETVGTLPTAATAGGAIAATAGGDALYVAAADRIVAFKPWDGTSFVVAAGQPYPTHILVDATWVYWDAGIGVDREILKAPVGGGLVTTVASGQQPTALAQDTLRLYWIDHSTKSLLTMAK